MKFTEELLLDRRRPDVWRIFDNPERRPDWQPTLKSIRRIQGEAGQAGSVSVLVFDDNGEDVVLEETVNERQAPSLYVATYHAPQVTNRITNRFETEGGIRTRWVLEAEYRFRGLLRLVAPFMRGAIQKRTRQDMARFKALVEGE